MIAAVFPTGVKLFILVLDTMLFGARQRPTCLHRSTRHDAPRKELGLISGRLHPSRRDGVLSCQRDDTAANFSSSASSTFSRIIFVALQRDSNVPASVHPPSIMSKLSFPSFR